VLEGQGKTSIISQGGLVNSRVFEGEGAVSSANSLTAATPGWTPNAYAGTHYVQLDSGGWAPIVTNTEDTLTLETERNNDSGYLLTTHSREAGAIYYLNLMGRFYPELPARLLYEMQPAVHLGGASPIQ